MASLAIIVCVIFLVVLLSGPIVFILSKFTLFPKTIIQLLSMITIIVGLWWFMIMVTPVRFIGILSAYFGWRAIQNSRMET